MSIFIRDFSPVGKLNNIKLGPFWALWVSLITYQKEYIYIHVTFLHIILVSLQTLWGVTIGSKGDWLEPWTLEEATIDQNTCFAHYQLWAWKTPFGLEKQSSLTQIHQKEVSHGRGITTVRRPPCACGSDRAQTWILIPEGVAEISKRKEKKERKKGKKKMFLNPTLDSSGRKWWCTFFQNTIAYLIACILLDKHFPTYFIIRKSQEIFTFKQLA